MRVILCGLVILLSAGSRALGAQGSSDLAVRSVGRGNATWVLLSGLVGGVAGFRALESTLLQDGVRVVTIDPYRLSIDSADVSFAALARRVDRVLDRLDVSHARVVGHSNGAGVALRLAAFAPDRVEALYLLDAGAHASNRGTVLGRSLRLVPIIARIPGGRAFLHARFVNGIRENLGRCEWFDAAAQRAYIDPILDEISRAVRLAVRLGESHEPDAVGVVVSRVRAPITAILGDAPHASRPAPEELTALASLGSRLLVIRLAGVGHFPHEEATAVVAQHLMRTRAHAPGARADQ